MISKTNPGKKDDNSASIIWPKADFSRVPYEVFYDEKVYDREQEKIYRGPVWNYLGLDAELPEPQCYITTNIGDDPVVVTRNEKGNIKAFINRCKHRGAAVVRDRCGKSDSLICVYHQWAYDHDGNLTGVPFRRGIKKKGGMPKDFQLKEHCLDKIYIQVYKGLIFGTYHKDTPPVETYLGDVKQYIDPLFSKPLKILGYNKQVIKSNWKIYAENTKDPYHASLLHLFHATFGLFRSTAQGGTVMDQSGMNSAVYSKYKTDDNESLTEAYSETRFQKIGVEETEFQLSDPSVLMGREEFDDGISALIIYLFPSVVIQRIGNTFATRKVIPKGPDEFELYWTYFGYTDDDAEMDEIRKKQANFIGPAGLISMEDGEAAGLVQHAVRSGREQHSIIEMGGVGDIANQDHLVTEVPIRGMWKAYHNLMKYDVDEKF